MDLVDSMEKRLVSNNLSMLSWRKLKNISLIHIDTHRNHIWVRLGDSLNTYFVKSAYDKLLIIPMLICCHKLTSTFTSFEHKSTPPYALQHRII